MSSTLPLGVFSVVALSLTLGQQASAIELQDECVPSVTVRTLQDDGPGSLRRALQIVCPAGDIDFDVPLPATIALDDAPLSINKSVTIVGPGADQLTVGLSRSRLLEVGSASVALSGMTLAGGFDFALGAGIFNRGDLTLTDVVVRDNLIDAFGSAQGAAIFNIGSLTLRRVTVSDNLAIAFGNLVVLEGAAIYNSRGRVVIEDSLIARNTVQAQGPVLFSVAALVNSEGRMVLRNTTVTHNAVSDESGGTISNDLGGVMEIEQSTITRNGSGRVVFMRQLGLDGTISLSNTIAAGNGVTATCLEPNLLVSLGHNIFDERVCAPVAPSDLVGVDPVLLPLDDYGGATNTVALGPASPALDGGDGARCAPTDQRGELRPQGAGCDVGAFEALPVDLLMRKRADAARAVGPGEAIEYTLDVTNVGGEVTMSAVVTDVLPPELVFVGPVTLDPPQADAILADDPSDLPTIASHLTVAPGETVSLRVPVVLADDASPGLSVVNTARVSSDEAPLPREGSATVQTCANEALVTSTDDHGEGSLRRAIETACVGAEVTFDLPPSSTISLSSGAIELSQSVTIRGPGPGLTVRAVGSRHFTIDRADVWIEDLTLIGGRAERGGAISSHFGDVRLSRLVLADNAAREAGGAVYQSGGRLVIDQSALTGNRVLGAQGGGAVFSESGTTQITRSALANNLASSIGGALATTTPENFSAGSITVSSSTVSGNQAGVGAGGIHVGARSALTVQSSTVANNVAPADGAGITSVDALSPIELFNTIVAGNGPGTNCVSVAGEIVSLGSNLDSDDSCGFSAPSDFPGVDPLLDRLRDNGGATLTNALLPGSPAIDAGTATRCPTFDQRGFGRPLDGDDDGLVRCDIGAFELAPVISSPSPRR